MRVVIAVAALGLAAFACSSFKGSDQSGGGGGGNADEGGDGADQAMGDSASNPTEGGVEDEASAPYKTPCNGQQVMGNPPAHVCDDFEKEAMLQPFWSINADGGTAIRTQSDIEGGLPMNYVAAMIIQSSDQAQTEMISREMASGSTYKVEFDYLLTNVGTARVTVFTLTDNNAKLASLDVDNMGMTVYLGGSIAANGKWPSGEGLNANAGWRHAVINLSFAAASASATFNGASTNAGTGAALSAPAKPVLAIGVQATTTVSDWAIQVDNVDFTAM